MASEIDARIGSVHLPPLSALNLAQDGALPQPPALTFFPAGSTGLTRIPLSGSVESRDLPYGTFESFADNNSAFPREINSLA